MSVHSRQARRKHFVVQVFINTARVIKHFLISTSVHINICKHNIPPHLNCTSW
ncbi:hypothetical protein Hanom_Chr15g01339211 [Helianthus anomalus]